MTKLQKWQQGRTTQQGQEIIPTGGCHHPSENKLEEIVGDNSNKGRIFSYRLVSSPTGKTTNYYLNFVGGNYTKYRMKFSKLSKQIATT